MSILPQHLHQVKFVSFERFVSLALDVIINTFHAGSAAISVEGWTPHPCHCLLPPNLCWHQVHFQCLLRLILQEEAKEVLRLALHQACRSLALLRVAMRDMIWLQAWSDTWPESMEGKLAALSCKCMLYLTFHNCWRPSPVNVYILWQLQWWICLLCIKYMLFQTRNMFDLFWNGKTSNLVNLSWLLFGLSWQSSDQFWGQGWQRTSYCVWHEWQLPGFNFVLRLLSCTTLF